jgi:hypothetical protein
MKKRLPLNCFRRRSTSKFSIDYYPLFFFRSVRRAPRPNRNVFDSDAAPRGALEYATNENCRSMHVTRYAYTQMSLVNKLSRNCMNMDDEQLRSCEESQRLV